MAVISTFYDFLICLTALSVLLYLYLTRNNNYWKKRGVFFLKPTVLFGNIFDVAFLRKSTFEVDQDFYRQFEGHAFGGIFEFTSPSLYIRDPDLVRAVFTKDFDHFVDRRFIQTNDPFMDKMMQFTRGQEWKNIRCAVSPTFTSGKLKNMMPMIEECGKQLVEYLEDYAKNGEPLEMKECYGRYTMDVIATTAFGLQTNTFKNPHSEFVKNAEKIQNPGMLKMIVMMVSVMTGEKVKRLFKALGFSLFNRKAVEFFVDVAKTTIEHREKHGVRRPDFLQLMLDARRGDLAKDEEKLDAFEKEAVIEAPPVNTKSVLTDDLIISQCLLFFTAGYDTTSQLLMFASYELAVNPDIQDRLRHEIETTMKKHNNKCSYDAIQEMHYLDMCLHETLRKNPLVSRIDRSCTSDYTIPGTDVVIEKDVVVAVPVYAIHYDETYYPDPHRFDPERFSSENKSNRSPYVYLPFGQGPRNCLGMRYALLEAKSALIHVLQKYRIKVSNKTTIPYKIDKKSPMLCPEGGMWLSVQRID